MSIGSAVKEVIFEKIPDLKSKWKRTRLFVTIAITFLTAIIFHLFLEKVVNYGAVLSQFIILTIASSLLMGGLLGHRKSYRKKYDNLAYRQAFFHFGVWGMPLMASTIIHPLIVRDERIIPIVAALIIGSCLLWIGFVLHRSAVETLRIDRMIFIYTYFPEEGNFVSTGIYSLIRHPIYSSAIHMVFGFGILRGSISSLICSILVLITFLIWIKIEEQEMRERGGEEYVKYQKNTSALFPKPSLMDKFCSQIFQRWVNK